MLIKTNVLVLKPRNVGENDKILFLLSEELGVIEATARGAQKQRNPFSLLCQPFCYARVELFRGKNNWLVNNVEILNAHYALSADPFGAALAAYFCEVVRVLSPTEETAGEYLKLLLNLFYLMEQGKRELKQLKAIFELRALVLAGFAPNLVACKDCGKFEADVMYFVPAEAELYCADCYQKEENRKKYAFSIGGAVLNAMRYIVYGDAHKIFSFAIREPSLSTLGALTEHYLLRCTDTRFLSLEVYRALLAPILPPSEQDP